MKKPYRRRGQFYEERPALQLPVPEPVPPKPQAKQSEPKRVIVIDLL